MAPPVEPQLKVERPRPEEAEAYRRLLDYQRSRSSDLPEALLRSGVRDMGVVVVMTDLFDSSASGLAGAYWDIAYADQNGMAARAPEPDYVELARKFGIEGDPDEWERTAEQICAALFENLFPLPPETGRKER
jgi:hypothetical protein